MAARWQKEKAAKEEAIAELDNVLKEQRNLQQQLGQMKSKLKTLASKLEEKENELENANQQMRQERNKQSASNVRARRDQILGSRAVGQQLRSTPSRSVTSSNRAAAAAAAAPAATGTPSAASVASTAATPSEASAATNGTESIRAHVLALLEKHDQSKVNRIDIIMEKFKGKEALLLEKMTQRYESEASIAGQVRFSSDFQKRNELALQRHHERMQRFREGVEQNGVSGSSTSVSK
jgi:hypothetical protein